MTITIRKHKDLDYVVSARELYQFLNIKESFDKVFMWMISISIENEDYIILNGSVPYEDNTPRIDYLITIEVVISVLRGCNNLNDRAKYAKKYFMLFRKILRKKWCIKEKMRYVTSELKVIDMRLEVMSNEFNITFK